MGRILLLAVLGLFLIVSLWWAAWVWGSLDAEISLNGNIALTLGVVVSIAVGVGLMALVFHSARSGHDEQVRYELPDDEG